MPSAKSTAVLATLALAASVCAASAQLVQKGRWYSFHTGAVGTCPGLDWDVVIDEDNSVSGFVAWDRMKHMATITGTVNKDGSFTQQTKEVGGTRQATITGKVSPEFVMLTLTGSGTGCDNQSWKVRRAVDSGGIGGGG
jgi:hypothetical protein